MYKKILLLLLLFLPTVCFLDSQTNSLLFRHLWTDKSGTSWQRKITTDSTINLPQFSVESFFSYNEIQSTVSHLSGSLSAFSTGINIAGKYAGIDAGGTILQGRNISLLTDHNYYNDKIDAAAGYIAFPVFIKKENNRNNFTIMPSFSAGCSSAGSGSFYWFLGKPVIPEFYDIGLTLKYKIFEFAAHTGMLNLDIHNNDDENLIHGTLFFTGESFSTGFEKGKWKLKSGLAYLYANGTFSGSLTAENQFYILYPYKYYTVDGTVLCHLICVSFDCSYNTDPFVFNLDGTAVFLPVQTGTYAAVWKYKNSIFFDGSSGSEKSDITFLDKSGCICLTPSIMIHMPAVQNIFQITLSKMFVVPFTSAAASTTTSSADDNNTFSGQPVLSWLLSGITLNVTLKI